ncbi:hypothetical protein [Candidatus Skiveiella danica]|uniref:hypothetical protein n=1 Tax=Candidatus Skiveiella danica TaxID=3386177 RepID=UPI0039B9C4A4
MEPVMNLSLKFSWRATLLAACTVAALAGGAAQAQDIPLITGEHWTKSTEQNKKAYLVGMTNMLQVEIAYQAGNTPRNRRPSCRGSPRA